MPDSLVNRPFVRFLVLACASALSVGTVAAQRAQLLHLAFQLRQLLLFLAVCQEHLLQLLLHLVQLQQRQLRFLTRFALAITQFRRGRLDEASRTLEPARRFAVLAEAESLALDQAVFLPVYHYSTTELVKPWVRGLYPTPLDQHPLKNVWIDHDWRAHDAAAEGTR